MQEPFLVQGRTGLSKKASKELAFSYSKEG